MAGRILNAAIVLLHCRYCVTIGGMNATLSIRLDENLARALSVEAQSTGLTRGAIARQALESRLQRGGKLSVLKRYMGVMRGQSDLGTNKKYRRQWNKNRA
jgi:predicted DNA-binding protein